MRHFRSERGLFSDLFTLLCINILRELCKYVTVLMRFIKPYALHVLKELWSDLLKSSLLGDELSLQGDKQCNCSKRTSITGAVEQRCLLFNPHIKQREATESQCYMSNFNHITLFFNEFVCFSG